MNKKLMITNNLVKERHQEQNHPGNKYDRDKIWDNIYLF